MPQEEVAMSLGDAATLLARDVVVIDSKTGDEILPENTVVIAGPAADETVLRRIALTQLRHNAVRAD